MCGISGIFGPGWGEGATCRHGRGSAPSRPRRRGFLHGPLRRRRPRSQPPEHHRSLARPAASPCRTPTAAYGSLSTARSTTTANCARSFSDYPYRSRTDTEVVLAAYERWGEQCLERFIGMFAFLIWDRRERKLFAARDRFGVKPLNYHLRPDGRAGTWRAKSARSTRPASRRAPTLRPGPPTSPTASWTTPSAPSGKTYARCRAGHYLTWRDGCRGHPALVRRGRSDRRRVRRPPRRAWCARNTWRCCAKASSCASARTCPWASASAAASTPPMLLGLVQAVQGPESDVKAFTYITGDPRYDELPWVRQMLAQTRHPSLVCELRPEDVPCARRRSAGAPERALRRPAHAGLRAHLRTRPRGRRDRAAGRPGHGRAVGRLRLLRRRIEPRVARAGNAAEPGDARLPHAGISRTGAAARRAAAVSRPCCATGSTATSATPRFRARCATTTASPCAPRSSCASLSSTTVSSSARCASRRTARSATGRASGCCARSPASLLPAGIVEAPKRPLQTPQREWLAGPLREWAGDHIELALAEFGGQWFDCARGAPRLARLSHGQERQQFLHLAMDQPGLDARQRAGGVL